MLRTANVKPRSARSGRRPTEYLGFPFAEPLLDDIRNLDLLTADRKPADRVLVIEGQASNLEPLADHLRSLQAAVDHRREPVADLWRWNEDVTKIQLPHQILRRIAAWISEAFR